VERLGEGVGGGRGERARELGHRRMVMIQRLGIIDSLWESSNNGRMNKTDILITGVTGKTGSRIQERLAARGITARTASRQSTVPFDWYDASTWTEALEGIRTAYLAFYPDLAVDGAPAIIQQFTDLAVARGVKKLVLLSGRGEANAQRCEDIVLRSGLEATVLRASWFAQNFSEGHFLEGVRAGVIAVPAGEVREPFLDIDDLAEVAERVLLEEGHEGKIYELTGPELLSFHQAAEQLSEASGLEVQYAPITLEQNYSMLEGIAGKEFAALITDLCREVLDGRNESLGDGVELVLHRRPRSFAEYCRQAADSGVWSMVQG
jgi:uncharacterized protein YbjT (DUF2867 family)